MCGSTTGAPRRWANHRPHPSRGRRSTCFQSGIAPVALTLLFEPDVPESKYDRAGDTGWYQIQVGAFSSTITAYSQYERLYNAGLRPWAELLEDSKAIRLSVRWIPAYQLERTVQALTALGFAEKDVLKKSEANPYR